MCPAKGGGRAQICYEERISVLRCGGEAGGGMEPGTHVRGAMKPPAETHGILLNADIYSAPIIIKKKTLYV